MILEFTFLVFLLTSPIKSFPQNLGTIENLDSETTVSDSVIAKIPGCSTSSLTEGEDTDILSDSQYPKRSPSLVDDSDLASSLDNEDQLVTTPSTFGRASNQYEGALAIEYEPEPDCGEHHHAFCCSFNTDPDKFGEKSLHKDYDCLDPEGLRRTGLDCTDKGVQLPNQVPWRKTWQCCKDRVRETHRIGEEYRETWIGLECDKGKHSESPDHNRVPNEKVTVPVPANRGVPNRAMCKPQKR